MKALIAILALLAAGIASAAPEFTAFATGPYDAVLARETCPSSPGWKRGMLEGRRACWRASPQNANYIDVCRVTPDNKILSGVWDCVNQRAGRFRPLVQF